jgi:hypothetical protein
LLPPLAPESDFTPAEVDRPQFRHKFSDFWPGILHPGTRSTHPAMQQPDLSRQCKDRKQ